MKSKQFVEQEKMQKEIKAKIVEWEDKEKVSSPLRFQPRDYLITIIVGMICLVMLILGSAL